MLLVAPVRRDRRAPVAASDAALRGIDRLDVPRLDIPAVTHIDYSARVQTVARETNPDYYDLIAEFERLTGCAVLVNTSFNVRGEPIVCTPADAYQCLMRTHIDRPLAGLAVPAHLGPVYRGWMHAAERMSRVTTPVLPGLVYFLALAPAGIIMRIVGRNPLAAPRARSSAWVERPAGARRSDMERQF